MVIAASPRKAHIDALGARHRGIIRGIEKKSISLRAAGFFNVEMSWTPPILPDGDVNFPMAVVG